jgi:hypothetical protein
MTECDIGDCSPFRMLERAAQDILMGHAAACESGRALRARSNARLGTSKLVAQPSTAAGLFAMQTQKIDHDRSRGREVVQTIGLAVLIAFGLGTPAMADGTVPEEYQGVWASAGDCKENFQNILSNTVNREFAACRVMQVLSSGHPESHTSTINLNCGGLQSREIWHGESIEGTDYLVIVQFEQGAGAGSPSIDMYKRCPEIPLSEIPLSEIPGNPVTETASREEIAPRGAQIVRHRPFPHSRATHMRKHRLQ